MGEDGNRLMLNQLAVFAAVFLLFQLGFDHLRGTPITIMLLLGIVATTAVATAMYGAPTWMIARRNNRGE